MVHNTLSVLVMA